MAKRRSRSSTRRDRAGWAEVVDDLRRSGQSLADYAEEHGLSARTLAWWRWELSRRSRPANAVARRKPTAHMSFVPVQLVPDRSKGPAVPVLRVVLGGDRRIEIAAGFDAETLCRLVRLLEALPC